MAKEPPNVWWSPSRQALLSEHRAGSESYYELLCRDRDGWFVSAEQAVELPADVIPLTP